MGDRGKISGLLGLEGEYLDFLILGYLRQAQLKKVFEDQLFKWGEYLLGGGSGVQGESGEI